MEAEVVAMVRLTTKFSYSKSNFVRFWPCFMLPREPQELLQVVVLNLF
jgi:hypothetical protein